MSERRILRGYQPTAGQNESDFSDPPQSGSGMQSPLSDDAEAILRRLDAILYVLNAMNNRDRMRYIRERIEVKP